MQHQTSGGDFGVLGFWYPKLEIRRGLYAVENELWRASNFTDGSGLSFVPQFSCQVLKKVAGQIIGESFGCTEKKNVDIRLMHE